jgi:hypothetical protein
MFKSRPSVKMNELDLVMRDLLHLNLNQMCSVYSSDISTLQFQVYKKNIIEYTEFLIRLNSMLDNNIQIYPYDVNLVLEKVYVSDFYTHRNKYIEPKDSTEVFVSKMISFLSTFNRLEQSNDKTFLIEKNLMMTHNVVSNIKILAKELEWLIIKTQ